MVTKMKMFGFLDHSQVKNQVNRQVKNQEQKSSPPSSSQFNMRNLAAMMKTQNAGCNSCRG
jgi:hypothetical protein